MSSAPKTKLLKDLLVQLAEYDAVSWLSIDRERRNLVLQILKQQQQTIREQRELIEHLWPWKKGMRQSMRENSKRS